MMTITQKKQDTALALAVSGRLDTVTAPELEQVLKTALDGISELTLDFADLAYVSSAGLRVILSAQKQMNKQGKMVIAHANDSIREIFDITGFADILTVVD